MEAPPNSLLLFAKRSKTSQSTRRDKNNFMVHRRKNEPGFPLTRQRSVTNYYWFSKFPWEAHPMQFKRERSSERGGPSSQPTSYPGSLFSPPRMQTLDPSQEVIVLMCKLLRWFIVMGRIKQQCVGHLKLESVVKATWSYSSWPTDKSPGGGGTPYNGLYGEAPP